MKKLLAVLLLAPATLTAQTRTLVSAYVATDPAIASNPLLVGGTMARETGPLGARLSVGFDVTAPPDGIGDSLAPQPTGIMSTDLDGQLFLGNPHGNAALIPYGVVGVGMRAYRFDGIGAAANYSYGAGFRAPLGAGFAMEGEARHREYFSQPTGGLEPPVTSGMEFRFGLNVGFGGQPPAVRPGSGAPGRGPSPTSIPFGASLVTSDARMRVAAATLNTAEQYLGVRYQWGGNTPQSGFDCSGFIRYVFDLNGVSVPRVSVDQARFGTPVPLEIRAFEPGDILAFASNGRQVDHTAIYVGNGHIIHSSSSGNGVRYDDLTSQRGKWYLDHLVAARRVIEGGIYLGADR